ncbi:hypothetical protein [Microbacterium timonense]|uniref:hypothetical protein n=1 Tax=Microbacterium timonense TaxID=2086576 RepID=UPI00190E743A|nr:hypothetical protein [Microbacterium timonense]
MNGPAPRPVLAPILDGDALEVAQFLHRELNTRIAPERWMAILRPRWASGPNHGFLLRADGEIVGVYAAVYSTREREDRRWEVCNLAAFCVVETHRAHSLRLVRALLAQKEFVFTDLSPSGNVPAMNDRLGFIRLEGATRLALNLPSWRRGADLVESLDEIAGILRGADAAIFADHRDAPAARHLVVRDHDRYAYLVYRRDRRKRLPLFATPLHVGGDPGLLADNWASVASRLLRHGHVVTLAEERVLGFAPGGVGTVLRSPRPRMFKGAVDQREIDYLYSELTQLEW